MKLSITIKFKMSSILSYILELQDKGFNEKELNLHIPIESYENLLTEVSYMDYKELKDILTKLKADEIIVKTELRNIHESKRYV